MVVRVIHQQCSKCIASMPRFSAKKVDRNLVEMRGKYLTLKRSTLSAGYSSNNSSHKSNHWSLFTLLQSLLKV